MLKAAMEDIDIDVPMLTEGSVSLTNWGELLPYDKRGSIVWGK
jgi:hypothetical protein